MCLPILETHYIIILAHSTLEFENVLPFIQDDKSRKDDAIQDYGIAVTNLHNNGENDETLHEYKQAVLKMLNLKSQKTIS